MFSVICSILVSWPCVVFLWQCSGIKIGKLPWLYDTIWFTNTSCGSSVLDDGWSSPAASTLRIVQEHCQSEALGENTGTVFKWHNNELY